MARMRENQVLAEGLSCDNEPGSEAIQIRFQRCRARKEMLFILFFLIVSYVFFSIFETAEELNLFLLSLEKYQFDEIIPTSVMGMVLLLVFSIRRWRDLRRELRKRLASEKTIEKLAYSDALTDLPNRLLLKDRVSQALERARREESHVALLFIDLDDFKKVNDSLGHSIGDDLLRAVARRLVSNVRASDTVARIGGDEFVLVLTGLLKDYDIASYGRKLVDIFSQPFDLGHHQIPISPSIGITLFPSDGDSLEELLKNADIAMYEAKSQGKNCYVFSSQELQRRVAEKVDLENKLRLSLSRDELSLVFQPQINLETASVSGVEALLRWNPHDGAPVSPGTFIPLAEETGCIVQIGEWVLRQACSQGQIWQEQFPGIRLAVNISSIQFKHPEFVETVSRILSETGFSPHLLDLELTENTLLEESTEMKNKLAELKRLGVNLSIDDFGIGYSSLSYLKYFAVDQLKIDKTFIHNMSQSSEDIAIVRAIISLASSLQMDLIAEGVESQDQVDILSAMGCHNIQGFLFSPPVSSDLIPGLLEETLRRLKSPDVHLGAAEAVQDEMPPNHIQPREMLFISNHSFHSCEKPLPLQQDVSLVQEV